MFKRALICTDFSDGLYRLVNFIPNLSASGLEQIVFLHAVPLWSQGGIPREDREKIEQAKARLSPALQNAAEGIEVKVEVVSSDKPHEAALRIANTYHSDIIITGADTRSMLDEKLFGSTSISLAQQTELPLMVLRPQLISTYTTEELKLRCQHLFRYLMVAYDGSESADYLVKRIKNYAQNRPQNSLEEILLIWVIEDSGRRELRTDDRIDRARETLEGIKQDLSTLNLQVNIEVRRGEPLVQILEAALEHDISAIAVSSVRSNKILDWSTPSFSSKLLRQCWHPIIFFSPSR